MMDYSFLTDEELERLAETKAETQLEKELVKRISRLLAEQERLITARMEPSQ